LQVAKSHGIPVLPPSINDSEAYFSVERMWNNQIQTRLNLRFFELLRGQVKNHPFF
jgi:DNA polymerase III alpha subunit